MWIPIETVMNTLRKFEFLIERKGGIDTWGKVLVWSKGVKGKEDGVYTAIFIEWPAANSKQSHWRDFNDQEGETLKPTHWMPLLPDPNAP